MGISIIIGLIILVIATVSVFMDRKEEPVESVYESPITRTLNKLVVTSRNSGETLEESFRDELFIALDSISYGLMSQCERDTLDCLVDLIEFLPEETLREYIKSKGGEQNES